MKFLAILALLLLGTAILLRAADPTTAPVTAPGIKLTFESNGTSDSRLVRLIALHVPEGQPASSFVEPGAFRATFEGFINLKIRGDYYFSARGNGEIELIVNDQPVLKVAGDDLSTQVSERIRLKKGPNRIVARYASPPRGDASLRLYWAEKTNPPEPVPPTVLVHDAADAKLRGSLEVRAGRELVAQMRCAKCHLSEGATEHAMPELNADAPSLSSIGSRLNGDWMARWINHPESIRDDATMPRLFQGKDEIDPRAMDVAAYLATLSDGPVADEHAIRPEDAAAGARLYTGLGCIACHTFGPGSDEPLRVTLAHARSKWRPGALIDYLRAPQQHYAWTRMPDFKLSADEARYLAAYILQQSPVTAMPPLDLGRADAQRGRELVQASGCLNCHALESQQAKLTAPTMAQVAKSNLSRGCLADDAQQRGNAPAFALDATERQSVRSFIARGPQALQRDTAAEFSERQITQLNCAACHAIDGQPDVWSSLKNEIEAIEQTLPPAEDELTGDQSRPSLTWAGEKLRSDWMTKFVAGQVSYKPRPWLLARMPAFESRAAMLSRGLAEQHGISIKPEPEGPIDEQLAAAGRTLIGKEGGFSCNTCHGVGAVPPTSPFEAHGPNFIYTTERYRKDFYLRWVRHPQRYEPGTRMPQYADIEGKTALRDFFDGDAARQFEAMWQYLRKGEQMEPPKQ